VPSYGVSSSQRVGGAMGSVRLYAGWYRGHRTAMEDRKEKWWACVVSLAEGV